jgi:hypothetical protein
MTGQFAAAAAALAALIATPAKAYADDPVPTVDQVVAIMAELTDPGRPAASKTDILTPGFSLDEAGTVDDHLHRMDAVGGLLPPKFVVTDIQSAPGGYAEPPWPPRVDTSTPPTPTPSCCSIRAGTG